MNKLLIGGLCGISALLTACETNVLQRDRPGVVYGNDGYRDHGHYNGSRNGYEGRRSDIDETTVNRTNINRTTVNETNVNRTTVNERNRPAQNVGGERRTQAQARENANSHSRATAPVKNKKGAKKNDAPAAAR